MGRASVDLATLGVRAGAGRFMSHQRWPQSALFWSPIMLRVACPGPVVGSIAVPRRIITTIVAITSSTVLRSGNNQMITTFVVIYLALLTSCDTNHYISMNVVI